MSEGSDEGSYEGSEDSKRKSPERQNCEMCGEEALSICSICDSGYCDPHSENKYIDLLDICLKCATRAVNSYYKLRQKMSRIEDDVTALRRTLNEE